MKVTKGTEIYQIISLKQYTRFLLSFSLSLNECSILFWRELANWVDTHVAWVSYQAEKEKASQRKLNFLCNLFDTK